MLVGLGAIARESTGVRNPDWAWFYFNKDVIFYKSPALA